jgi:hypothetical protein
MLKKLLNWHWKRGVKEDCPDCGGGEIITPLEADRNRQREEGEEKE